MNSFITQFRFSDSEQPPHNHYHLSCEVIYVTEGEAEFLVDGHRYLARSGSIVFLNSFEQHEVRALSAPYRRYFMIIDSVEMERLLSCAALASIFKNRPVGFSHCVSLPEQLHEEMQLLFRQLYREYSAPGLYSTQLIRDLFEQMLIRVCRVCPGNFTIGDSSYAGRIGDIQKYIESHFTEDIRIADLAKQFFISPYYLSHTFKAQVGCSPKQYIQLNRLSYAKELLETTDLQVGQIAYQCGFGDINNFIRAFREWFGASPNRYRGESEKEKSEGI
ncbi:MAG: helix-turn-helix transcriptional regulator [Oscillospiraceae bacterium]|nr:helix-turn-helix transcriptional regulator [Oscillospiraceae bacterium]